MVCPEWQNSVNHPGGVFSAKVTSERKALKRYVEHRLFGKSHLNGTVDVDVSPFGRYHILQQGYTCNRLIG